MHNTWTLLITFSIVQGDTINTYLKRSALLRKLEQQTTSAALAYAGELQMPCASTALPGSVIARMSKLCGHSMGTLMRMCVCV